MALLKGLQAGLAKTREGLVGKIQRAVWGKGRVDNTLLEEIEEILITSDLGVDTSLELVERVRDRLSQQGGRGVEHLREWLKEELKGILQDSTKVRQDPFGASFFEVDQKPFVIMVVGVNGTGKTTTIGKIAYRFVQRGRRVLVAAADTFRAAAIEQLEIWARRAGAGFIRQQPGADPAAVAFDAIQAAVAREMDVLIVDTAGRLHTKVNLMEELKKIRRVLSRKVETAPHEVLLILDATTGQNALQQARQFQQAVEVTGIVLTKLDGTAKGGIIVPICRELGIPVKFVGVGEGIEDLEPFDPEAFVEALFEGEEVNVL